MVRVGIVGIVLLVGFLGLLAGSFLWPLDSASKPENLVPLMSVLPDPTGELTIEDVRSDSWSKRFEPLEGMAINLGITDHPFWFHVPLRNETEYLKKLALELRNPRLSHVTYYGYYADGEPDIREAGVLTPTDRHSWVSPEPAFAIDLPPGAEYDAYIRIEHHGGLRFGAVLWERRDFRRHSTIVVGWCAFFVGAIALIALYNAVVFIDLRERSYLYLALLSAVLSLYVLSKNGFARFLFWSWSPWWSDRADTALMAVVMALTVLFADSFLQAQKFAPRLSRVAQLIAVLFIAETLLVIMESPIKYYIIHVSGLVGMGLICMLTWRALQAGYAPAWSFVLALAPALIGTTILSLLGPGFLPSNPVIEYGVEFCFVITGALWLQSLTSRLRIQEAEHREDLEQRVAERTAELSKALAEVKTLSGLLPMCSNCKMIRDDKGYWNGVEAYVEAHSDAQFSHGLCPDCAHELFKDYFEPDEEIECN